MEAKSYLMEFDLETDRSAWCNAMRLEYSPKGMCNEDGSINQDFFRPAKVIMVNTEQKKWGEAEAALLMQGIKKHGVGNWRPIKTELLPNWDEQGLRLRTCRLLGTQNLERYKGWKGGKAEIESEQAKNKAIGDRFGCWKAGMLVDDNEGTLAKYFAQQAGGGKA